MNKHLGSSFSEYFLKEHEELAKRLVEAEEALSWYCHDKGGQSYNYFKRHGYLVLADYPENLISQAEAPLKPQKETVS